MFAVVRIRMELPGLKLQQYKMGRVVTGLKHCKPGLKKHCKPRVKTGLDKKNDLNQIKKQTSEN